MALDGYETAAAEPRNADRRVGAPRKTARKTRKGKKGKRSSAGSVDRDGMSQSLATAQEAMPIACVQGSFLRRTDGKKVVLVKISGVNDSLYTYDQKLRESQGLAAALVAVNRPACILKLPKAIDANASLVYIDHQIEALEREILQEGVSDRGDPRSVRLALLKNHVRPEAEHEALAGDKFTHPTYLAIEYDDVPDEVAKREAQIFADRVCDHGREAHVCDHDEAVEALMLYFTPSRVDVARQYGRSPVMAITRKGNMQ